MNALIRSIKPMPFVLAALSAFAMHKLDAPGWAMLQGFLTIWFLCHIAVTLLHNINAVYHLLVRKEGSKK